MLARQASEWFRDEDLVALHRRDFGRPSVPPSQLHLALLLQAHDVASDDEELATMKLGSKRRGSLLIACARELLTIFNAMVRDQSDWRTVSP